MGVCCVKQHNQDQGEFNEKTKKNDIIDLLQDDRSAIEKIVRIQAAMRRYLCSRKVKKLKESKKPNAAIEIPQPEIVNMISENAKVQELEVKLGPFKHEITETQKGREKRPPVVLDNGAKYCGEWSKEINKRDGYGVQIWDDGSK